MCKQACSRKNNNYQNKLSWINKFRIHAKIEFYTLHNVTRPSAFLKCICIEIFDNIFIG